MNHKQIFKEHEKLMDIITDEIMNSVSKKNIAPCLLCNGTGFYAAPNGQDDYDMELCECKQPN